MEHEHGRFIRGFTPRVFATRASWPSGVDTDGGVDWRERSWRNQWISTNPRSTPVAVSPYHLGAWHGPLCRDSGSCLACSFLCNRVRWCDSSTRWVRNLSMLIPASDFATSSTIVKIYSFLIACQCVLHVWNIFNTRDIVFWTRVLVRPTDKTRANEASVCL